jgi:putative NADH-flavin reductase
MAVINNKYAIFGSTGKSGSALTEVLLASSPDNVINAYCRNAAKMTNLFPEAVRSKRIIIFEGDIFNTELFSRCAHGCGIAFMCVTMNDNIPNMHIAEDAARTLITSLKKTVHLHGQKNAVPKIVVLSSASLEPSLCGNLSSVFHWVVTHANSYTYEDLRRAEALLRAEQDWLSSIFIKPGGLSVDKPRGHKLNLHQQETFISYMDLAGAMIEAGSDPEGRYDMKNVSVNNVGGSAKMPSSLPLLCLTGLMRWAFPWLHPYLPLYG